MNFQTERTASICSRKGAVCAIAFAEKAEVHGISFGGLKHALNMPCAGGNGGGVGAVGGGAAAD